VRLVHLAVGPLDFREGAWRQLASAGCGSTSYHNPDLVWISALALDLQVASWGVWADSELVGGLVLQRRRGQRPAPEPVVAFNGPVIQRSSSTFRSTRDRHNAVVTGLLLDHISQVAPSALVRLSTEIADIRELMTRGWQVRPTFTYIWRIADLAEAWMAMDRNRRRLVRRAESQGYIVESLPSLGDDPLALSRILVELQMRQLTTYGDAIPADAVRWHRLIDPLLRNGSARLFVTMSPSSEIVAFQLSSVWAGQGGNMLTGSDPRHAEQGANSLLRWRAAELLNCDGVTTLDLNGARPGDAGRFKASFGARIAERWDTWRPDSAPRPHLARHLAGRLRREVTHAAAARRRRARQP
jgi:hypothetical protein